MKGPYYGCPWGVGGGGRGGWSHHSYDDYRCDVALLIWCVNVTFVVTIRWCLIEIVGMPQYRYCEYRSGIQIR